MLKIVTISTHLKCDDNIVWLDRYKTEKLRTIDISLHCERNLMRLTKIHESMQMIRIVSHSEWVYVEKLNAGRNIQNLHYQYPIS